jgi:hypothetical protein
VDVDAVHPGPSSARRFVMSPEAAGERRSAILVILVLFVFGSGLMFVWLDSSLTIFCTGLEGSWIAYG